MLVQKKTAFKPKAKAVPRRNAPAASASAPTPVPATSQDAVDKPSSTSQPLSGTPVPSAPAPEKLSTSQPPDKSAPNTKETAPVQERAEKAATAPGLPADEGSTSSAAPAVVDSSNRGTALPAAVLAPRSEAEPPAHEPPRTQVISPSEASIPDVGSTSNLVSKAPPTATSHDVTSTPDLSPSIQPARIASIQSRSAQAATPPIEKTANVEPEPEPTVKAAAQTAPPAVTPPVDEATNGQPRPTVEVAAPTVTPAAKRGRKRKADATTGEGPSPADGVAAPKKRPRAKKAASIQNEEGESSAPDGQAAPKPSRTRKRKSAAAEGLDEDGGENEAQAKKARLREATPEDAEAVEIDTTQVKMADLIKDMHVGKKFSLHDELMERERAKRQKEYERRRQRKNSTANGGEGEAAGSASTPGPDGNPASTPATENAANAAAEEPPSDRAGALAPAGETYQIVDGVIVVDSRSLQVDRHARAAEAAGELEEFEENEFTHHTTSATYLRRKMKAKQWPDEETEKFYTALGMFGTDFDTISRMFPDKTRKHIKLKFNREERANPQRITEALVGKKTVAINIDEYQRQTGQEYQTAEAIYAEQKKAEEEFEARQKAIADEKAEELRKKKEALFGAPDADPEANTGAKKGRRGRKKARVEVGL
ncbi:transcription factor TFIIIB component-like protein [Podospora didyma]|uniref:Transcription factor TFIIIB component-like protein n=1 Tax=Podospora didyma TaxID=330526 RepID=A0AAE0KF84_9PEZI|nr:transcription factor TFIIIB component-like protein [Podospora didyma]